MNFNEILYGVAYYDEYMPYDRIETDFKMIRDAGMNVIRIAESTWSTWEPKEGVFDFTHLHRMLDCAAKYELKVVHKKKLILTMEDDVDSEELLKIFLKTQLKEEKEQSELLGIIAEKVSEESCTEQCESCQKYCPASEECMATDENVRCTKCEYLCEACGICELKK